jgi:hypothetical protein
MPEVRKIWRVLVERENEANEYERKPEQASKESY